VDDGRALCGAIFELGEFELGESGRGDLNMKFRRNSRTSGAMLQTGMDAGQGADQHSASTGVK
jgi:hypothetical protein